MTKIDDTLPELKLILAILVTFVIALVFQLSGVWTTMLIAGVIGSLFVRHHRIAFPVGFLGVLLAWLVLYVIDIVTAQGLMIADFFLGLLGLEGLGWLLIVIGCVIGGLLGGFGALLGRSIVELIDAILPEGVESSVEG